MLLDNCLQLCICRSIDYLACEQAPSEVGKRYSVSESERRDSVSEGRPLSARSARPGL